MTGTGLRAGPPGAFPRKRARPGGAELEAGHVGLLGADGLGGGAQGGQLGFGQVTLDDAAHAFGADLGLDAQVDARDAVLAVHQAQTGRTAPESSATARAIRAAAAEGA